MSLLLFVQGVMARAGTARQNMRFEAKWKGETDEAYGLWQAIVAKERDKVPLSQLQVAALAFVVVSLRLHNSCVHNCVTVDGSSVPLHAAAQLADGYLLHPTSSQAFEYGGEGVGCVCVCETCVCVLV